MPTIRRVKSEADLAAIREAMGDQDTLRVMPTHIIEKDGKVVGHWSVGAVPLVLGWHDKDLNVRDSISIMEAFKAVMDDRGIQDYLIGLSKDSPYNAYMTKSGFEDFGRTTLYRGGK